AAADALGAAVDARLDGGVVGRLRPEAAGRGVADDVSFVFRDEQAMASGCRVIVEPLAALLRHERDDVERDRRVDDVVVVDVGEGGEVGVHRGPDCGHVQYYG